MGGDLEVLNWRLRGTPLVGHHVQVSATAHHALTVTRVDSRHLRG